jgi:hypothetical protein
MVAACYANSAPSENWVCGIPTLVDPAHINLFDFDVVGNELVVNSSTKGINLKYPVLQNDQKVLVFRWLDTPNPPSIAVIDKILGSFKVYQNAQMPDYGGIEGLISAEGSCQRFER